MTAKNNLVFALHTSLPSLRRKAMRSMNSAQTINVRTRVCVCVFVCVCVGVWVCLCAWQHTYLQARANTAEIAMPWVCCRCPVALCQAYARSFGRFLHLHQAEVGVCDRTESLPELYMHRHPGAANCLQDTKEVVNCGWCAHLVCTCMHAHICACVVRVCMCV